MSRVSIVMPCYNAEKYLVEALNSILAQDFEDFELLAANDASTDTTLDILNEFSGRDPRIVVLQNKYQKGIVGALNTGLEESQGDYIARADADDILRPYRLTEQVDFLGSHPEVALLGGGYAPFNEKGTRTQIYHPTSAVELAWKQINDTFFCHPSVMFRRSLLTEIEGYQPVKAEDFEFFSRIIKQHQTANLPKILIDYREHQSNLSTTNADLIKQSVEVTARKNYEYYLGDQQDFELFRSYQAGGTLNRDEFNKIRGINSKILNKIRADYQLSLLNAGYLRFQLKLWRSYVRFVFSKIKHKYL